MPTKIRLQRRGKKGQPFYHIVIADGRAPRDGRFIEKIGTYNPLVKPADIKLDFDKALQWLQNGAQPTNTARAILSYKGVLHKNHLLKGVQKGAMTEEEAEAKFQTWLSQKEASILQKIKDQELENKESKKKTLEQERKINEAIAAKVAEKRASKKFGEEEDQEEKEESIQQDPPQADETAPTSTEEKPDKDPVETLAKEEKSEEEKPEEEKPEEEAVKDEVVKDEKPENKVDKEDTSKKEEEQAEESEENKEKAE